MFDNGMLAFFVGSDWREQAIAAGETASEADVLSRVALECKAFEEQNDTLLDDALRNAAAAYNLNHISFVVDIDKTMADLDWSGYTNREEIRTHVNAAMRNYRAALKLRSEEFRKKVSDEAHAAYLNLVSNDNTRSERFKRIAALMEKYKAEHVFRDKLAGEYDSSPSVALIQMRADLTAFTGEKLEGGEKVAYYRDSDRTNALWDWNRIFTMKKRLFIQSVEEKAEPVVEEVAVTPKQQSKVDNLNQMSLGTAKIADKLMDLGIELKEVTEDLEWVQKRKRQRFGTSHSIEAYSHLALFDNNGFKGALRPTFAGNKALKEKYGAKFGTNASSHFDGGWWFIDATSDLDELYDDILGHAEQAA
jgi:hypothetical protein